MRPSHGDGHIPATTMLPGCLSGVPCPSLLGRRAGPSLCAYPTRPGYHRILFAEILADISLVLSSPILPSLLDYFTPNLPEWFSRGSYRSINDKIQITKGLFFNCKHPRPESNLIRNAFRNDYETPISYNE